MLFTFEDLRDEEEIPRTEYVNGRVIEVVDLEEYDD